MCEYIQLYFSQVNITKFSADPPVYVIGAHREFAEHFSDIIR